MFTAVILAAGEASRMGKLKQLLPWKESTILETVLKNILACREIDDEIRVVIGAEAGRVSKVLETYSDSRLRVIINEDYQQGMLTSVRKGIEGLPGTTEHILFTLADKPFITTDIYKEVIKRYRKVLPAIFVPVYGKRRGHPVIVSVDLSDEIYELEGRGGLRNLIKDNPDRVYRYPCDDKAIVTDIDYYGEYLNYREGGL